MMFAVMYAKLRCWYSGGKGRGSAGAEVAAGAGTALGPAPVPRVRSSSSRMWSKFAAYASEDTVDFTLSENDLRKDMGAFYNRLPLKRTIVAVHPDSCMSRRLSSKRLSLAPAARKGGEPTMTASMVSQMYAKILKMSSENVRCGGGRVCADGGLGSPGRCPRL